MNKTSNYIKNVLSLRTPQAESLEILEKITDKIDLMQSRSLEEDLEIIKSMYPICSDFERDFLSMCFALATGVGKTRLMGAFIAYLHIEKNINNFMIIAPNITIYNKLIEDLNPANPKYILNGIAEFSNQSSVNIIHGDNYKKTYTGQSNLAKININIFNISKIDAKTKGDTELQIKKLSEYIGMSYFKYLSNLNDLVILMDESHHYRAERGMQILNELNPVLGLELTATPQVEKSNKTIPFKNVVYQYSLAKAIRDGFVKSPVVITKKNFEPDKYNPEDLDYMKLMDGIRMHEDTKVELDIYSRNNDVQKVKPFVLVVTKDTEHASKIKEIIQNDNFYNGYYKDKVIEVHSNKSKQELDENIQQLLLLENINNAIEIVIHVNMLKEGWDVTNLYTIVPLRTSASSTLTEQTIGRGLRLPYGKITGDEKVDRLSIVAHDKYDEIIKEANKPDSIIRQENIINIEDSDTDRPKEAITNMSNFENNILREESEIYTVDNWQNDDETLNRYKKIQADKQITDIIKKSNIKVGSINEYKKEAIKETVLKQLEETLEEDGQTIIEHFKKEIVEEASKRYDDIIDNTAKHIIEIPKIILRQKGNITAEFKDFDLEIEDLNYQPSSDELLVHNLQENKTIEIKANEGVYEFDNIESMIVSEIIKYPEIDYDSCNTLIYKLVMQAIAKFTTYLKEKEIINVVFNYKVDIGKYIYTQMKQHLEIKESEYAEPIIYPFTEIYNHNYVRYLDENDLHYTVTVEPSEIKRKIFIGFTKAYHDRYKFDSTSEKDFTVILENSQEVIKWLRPTDKQFDIWYNNNSQKYEPDFVAETEDTIYMIEVKARKDLEQPDVIAKKNASLKYCKYASDFTKVNGGKQWKYMLVPHDEIGFSKDFDYYKKFAE